MRVSFHRGPVDRIETGTLVVGYYEGDGPLRGEAGVLDWRMHGWLGRLLVEGKINGTFGDSLLIPAQRLLAERVILVGLGTPEHLDAERINKVASDVREKISGLKEKRVGLAMPIKGGAGIVVEMLRNVGVEELTVISKTDTEEEDTHDAR